MEELSYNNILDLTAPRISCEFASDNRPLAIFKHTNPCGVGQGLARSLEKRCDRSKAPFGGIIVSSSLDAALLKQSRIFSEVIVAPEFAARPWRFAKKKICVLRF